MIIPFGPLIVIAVVIVSVPLARRVRWIASGAFFLSKGRHVLVHWTVHRGPAQHVVLLLGKLLVFGLEGILFFFGGIRPGYGAPGLVSELVCSCWTGVLFII